MKCNHHCVTTFLTHHWHIPILFGLGFVLLIAGWHFVKKPALIKHHHSYYSAHHAPAPVVPINYTQGQ